MGRLRGFFWLMTGLIVAIMAGFVAYITLSRATVQESDGLVRAPEVEVVVAARAVSVGTLLAADDVEIRSLPVNVIPEGSLRSIDDAVNQLTLVDLYPGEVLLSQRLIDPNIISGDGRIAVLVAEDEVLMAFPTEDLMSRTGILKPGDQIDLLFSVNVPYSEITQTSAGGSAAGAVQVSVQEKEEQTTFNVLQNVTVAAIVGSETTTGGTASTVDALLLTVSPQDALVLKYVIDADGIADIVLRSPGSDQPFDIEPVDIDFIIDRYQIPVGRQR